MSDESSHYLSALVGGLGGVAVAGLGLLLALRTRRGKPPQGEGRKKRPPKGKNHVGRKASK